MASLIIAIFLSEYAPDGLRKVVKPALEILAGIPTVVYGFFAVSFITPNVLQSFLEVGTFNKLSPGLVMGVLIIPTVATLSEDAMSAVPQALRDGAYGLGSTKRQVATRVVVRSSCHASSGWAWRSLRTAHSSSASLSTAISTVACSPASCSSSCSDVSSYCRPPGNRGCQPTHCMTCC